MFSKIFCWIFAVKIRKKMRQRFEQQTTLGITPVPEVKFPLRSRDELPPVLKALQYIFVTTELNEKVFSLLEEKVCKGKKRTGRPGLSDYKKMRHEKIFF